MNYHVNRAEKIYFFIMLLISILMYCILIGAAFISPESVAIYTIFLAFIRGIYSLLFFGYLKGHAIKVTPQQFPEFYDILKNYSQTLKLKQIPTMYILQGNGIFNALAARTAGKNVIILYSNVMEAAQQEGIEAISFIIGHELGHIKRKHTSRLKNLLMLPTKLIPLIDQAYSRACEYTCDAIGYSLCPSGAEKGLLILAVGNKLYKKVNVNELLLTGNQDWGFATWFAEKWSTHPTLIKRIERINQLNKENEYNRNLNFFGSLKTTTNEENLQSLNHEQIL